MKSTLLPHISQSGFPEVDSAARYVLFKCDSPLKTGRTDNAADNTNKIQNPIIIDNHRKTVSIVPRSNNKSKDLMQVWYSNKTKIAVTP